MEKLFKNLSLFVFVAVLGFCFFSCGGGIVGTWNISVDEEEGEEVTETIIIKKDGTIENKVIGSKSTKNYKGSYKYEQPLLTVSFSSVGKENAVGKVDEYEKLDNEIVERFIVDGKIMFRAEKYAMEKQEERDNPEDGVWYRKTYKSSALGNLEVYEYIDVKRGEKNDDGTITGEGTFKRLVDPDSWFGVEMDYTCSYIFNPKNNAFIYIGSSEEYGPFISDGRIVNGKLYIAEETFEKKK